MSAGTRAQPSMSVAEYLAFEAQSPTKHEYAAGQVFAMAGASARHNLISGNIFAALRSATRQSNCAVFFADMRIQINEVIYYPDLMVCCDPNDRDTYLKTRPCLVVEVLSDSTERIDRGEKLYNYQRIPTLEGYLLVSQDQLRVDLYRRVDGVWQFTTCNQWEDHIALPCPEATLALSEIYERIEFDGAP
jgi:Uma2 family endonuclease